MTNQPDIEDAMWTPCPRCGEVADFQDFYVCPDCGEMVCRNCHYSGPCVCQENDDD